MISDFIGSLVSALHAVAIYFEKLKLKQLKTKRDVRHE